MPNWKKVIVSGSDAALNSLNVTNLLSVTGSSNLTGSLNISGSASILGNTGTTTFYTNADTLIFTGSVYISGSIVQTGSLNITNVTSSLFGTASWAQNAITSSHAVNALSASYALTASFALNGGGGGGAITYHQTASAVTWSVPHSLNTYTPIVQVYDEAYNQLIPASVSGSSLTSVQITFSTTTAGYAVLSTGGNVSISISGSNATLVQSTPATTWSFYHGLNETYPVFTIFDSNDDVIVPLKIHADNANTASIYFTTARTGTAVAANCGLSGSTFESASWAATASFAQTTATASYVLNAVSASYATNALSASYAQTSSYANNFTVAGTLTAQTIVVQVITSSTELITGSLTVSSSLNALGGVTGSLLGTASWAENAITASYSATASSALNASDILIYVKNSTGTQIDKGKVVRIIGAVGDNPLIATASYEDDNNSANTLGITNENIANDSFGYVMTEGKLLGINTNLFSVGQLLYLGANGTITGSAPQAPLHAVRLGQVLRVQLNNGSMYVRIDNGYEIGELHDVRDTTTTGSYGDLFVKSGSVWINSNQLTGSYGLTGSLNATSITSSLFGTSSWARNAISSSYPVAAIGNIIYTPLGGVSPNTTFATGSNQSNIILGYQAGLNTTGSSNEGEGSIYIGAYAGKDSYNNYSTIFIGEGAGERSTYNAFSTTIGAYAGYLSTASYESVAIGYNAGFRNEDSYFTTIVGEDAGYRIKASYGATILGNGGGSTALSSSYATIIGYSAGPYIKNSPGSIFIAPWSGEDSMSGSYSIVIGNSSGRLRIGNQTLGTNNIIIGTNIALTPGTNHGINIGGLIFGSGSAFQGMNSNGSGYVGYTNSFTGSANGKIGINQPTPQYNFDVSGSGNYTNGLTVTGSLTTTKGEYIRGYDTYSLTGYSLTPTNFNVGSLYVNDTTTFDGTSALNVISYRSQPQYTLTGTSTSALTLQPFLAYPVVNLTGTNARIDMTGYTGYIWRTDPADVSTNGSNRLRGAYFIVGNRGGNGLTSTPYTNTVTGYEGSIENGGGTVNNMFGLRNYFWHGEFAANSTTNNNYGIYQGMTIGAASGGSHVVTNYYAFYQDTPSVLATGTLTNRWGLYFTDPNMPSYHAGKFGIGKTSPTYNLDVSGSGNFTNGLTVTGSFQATSLTGSLNVTGNSTYSGSQTFTTGYIVLTQVSQSLNYVDDADAAANGVPLGGLYRNGNFIAIRIV
jgi:hypothetical protein